MQPFEVLFTSCMLPKNNFVLPICILDDLEHSQEWPPPPPPLGSTNVPFLINIHGSVPLTPLTLFHISFSIESCYSFVLLRMCSVLVTHSELCAQACCPTELAPAFCRVKICTLNVIEVLLGCFVCL